MRINMVHNLVLFIENLSKESLTFLLGVQTVVVGKSTYSAKSLVYFFQRFKIQKGFDRWKRIREPAEVLGILFRE
jgi:hypothetical protein